jgi:hypothetical protein
MLEVKMSGFFGGKNGYTSYENLRVSKGKR